MPHEPGHTNVNMTYTVYGTNEPYNGMTVEIGGYLYTIIKSGTSDLELIKEILYNLQLFLF